MQPLSSLVRSRPLLLLALCAACQSAEAGGAVVETLANGTVHVRNTDRGAWTDKTAWRAVEDLRIGSEDGGGPDMFGDPTALEVDGAGRMYVLDRQSKEIRVFGPDGRHLRTMGREGAGPGEFKNPVGLAFNRSGALWVVDPGNARYSVLDSTGRETATHPRRSILTSVPWPGRMDATGGVWDVDMNPQDMSTGLLRLQNGTGTPARFPLPSASTEQFELKKDGNVRMAVPVPFAPGLSWTLDQDGRIWSGDGAGYRLARHAPGGDTLLLVEKEYEPVPVTAAERDSLRHQLKWFTDQGGQIDLSRVPSRKPAFTRLLTDDRGWLWVRGAAPAGEQAARFDVFNPEGRYQGRVTLPAPVGDYSAMLVRGAAVYAVTHSEDEVPQVVRFRLEGRR